MEDHSRQRLLFKGLGGKTPEADFEGGEVTSDAGLLLIREAERRLGLFRGVAEVIGDSRHQGYVRHGLEEMLRQRVFQIIAGYEDADDSDALRQDAALKMACGRCPESDPPLASQPTMSRLENGVSRTDLYRIARIILDLFMASYETPPEAIILDIDDTEDETHGGQQLRLFNAFYDSYCFQPIHIDEGGSGRLITAILRPGKRPGGKEIVAILKRVVAGLREAWPEVGIIIRGDSHYSGPEVVEFCEVWNLKYILGLTPYKTLLEEARPMMDEARLQAEMLRRPVKLYGEFHYQARTWQSPRRIVFKAEHNGLGPAVRFVVTNLKSATPSFLYQTAYCGRGRMELFIKEHKTHLFSDRTSCSRFEANQFRLLLHSLAYVLLDTFRRLHLSGTQWAHAQFDTIRLRLLKIGARVLELRTKIKIHLPSSFPWKADFRIIWRSCCFP
jgi:hypothetical protein